MQHTSHDPNSSTYELIHDLGHYEGFNFRSQSAIFKDLSAQDVVDWDHDKDGEPEFWPAGDHAGVQLLFAQQSSVSAQELTRLDTLLEELGSDEIETFIKMHLTETSLSTLIASDVEDQNTHLFTGTNFIDLRNEAATELFELYYPEEHAVWVKSHCDGLIFDADRFLDSPSFSTTEFSLADGTKILSVTPL